MLDLKQLHHTGIKYSSQIYGSGEEQIEVVIFDSPFENKLIGLIQSKMFSDLIPISWSRQDDECIVLASLGVSRDKQPSIRLHELYKDEVGRATDEVLTIFFHELGHLYHKDHLIDEYEDDASRMQLIENHSVSERECKADLFAVKYLGKETVMSGLAQLQNRMRQYIDFENADIAIMEIQKRIQNISDIKNQKEKHMKNILIISSSPRRNGNSEALAASFAKGATEAGNRVETIFLREKQLGFCRGCMACAKLGHCVIRDDAVEIAAKMHDADVLVFASPVYYYSVSGQLKTMFDRANPLYDTDYAFKEVYFLSTAAEDEDHTVEGSVKAVQGWIDCFERAKLSGVIFAGGVTDVGDIQSHPALQKAYTTGKSI